LGPISRVCRSRPGQGVIFRAPVRAAIIEVLRLKYLQGVRKKIQKPIQMTGPVGAAKLGEPFSAMISR